MILYLKRKEIESGGGHVWSKTSCCLPKFGPNLLVSNQASVQVSLIQAQSKQCDTQLGFVTAVGVSKNTFNNTCLMY